MYKADESKFIKCNDKIGNFECKTCDEAQKYCTYKKVVVFYLQSYMEGSSLYGVFMKEKVMFGNSADNVDPGENGTHNIEDQIAIPLGCTNMETGMFTTQTANGIIGFYAMSNSRNG